MQRFLNYIFVNRDAQFWLFQFLGWFAHSVISFVSLNLWYNDPTAVYILHNIFQSILGALLSWPLRYFYTHNWNKSLLLRLVQIVWAILLLSLIWSAVRIETFIWMTGEGGLWAEFGGWYFSSVFVFAAWSAIYFGMKYYLFFQEEHSNLLRMQFEREEESKKRFQAEAIAQAAELKMLRYQLNPHFMFNTLNSVISLVSANENADASQMLVRLSKFMRYSLDKNHENLVCLLDEINAIEVYLKIEEVRFQDRLAVNFDVPVSLQKAQVPGLLLQPLAENAIKYGISPSEDGGEIIIVVRSNDDRLIIEVKDRAYSDAQDIIENKTQGFGVGLSNTRQRLENLYGDDFSLDINIDQPGSASVLINIPLKFENNL